MTITPNTCPLCAAEPWDGAHASAERHAHLLRAPEWTAIEVMAFVDDVCSQLDLGVAVGDVPADELECWAAVHFDPDSPIVVLFRALDCLARRAQRREMATVPAPASADVEAVVDRCSAIATRLGSLGERLAVVSDMLIVSDIERREFPDE